MCVVCVMGVCGCVRGVCECVNGRDMVGGGVGEVCVGVCVYRSEEKGVGDRREEQGEGKREKGKRRGKTQLARESELGVAQRVSERDRVSGEGSERE